MAGDELVPQLARAGAAHDRAQVERANLVKGCRRRERRRFGVRPEDDGPGPVLPPLRRRQGDQAVLVHGQHGHPRHHVLEPAVGLEPADAPAELLRQGMAVQRRRAGDQRAQQRHLPRREVAPVIAALDRAGHPGAIDSFRRSASIDQGSHGERSPGAHPPLSAHAASHAVSQRRTSTPFNARVPTTEYIVAVNRAPASLLEPNESRRPMAAPCSRRSERLCRYRHNRSNADNRIMPRSGSKSLIQRGAELSLAA